MKIGKENGMWKGDKAGYKAIHMWVNKWKGKASKCAECGSTEHVWWANISGKYKRDLDDYIELCCKCHRKKDFTDEWRENIRQAMIGDKNHFYGKQHTTKTKEKLSKIAKKIKWKRNKLGHFVSHL